jgi:DMSO/TMAO reductase YedYZ molybdopterin-dependent catalytic subunit
MTQIKWLSRIEVIDRRYEGQHQVRNYLSLRAVETPEGPLWLDQSISKTNMKSLVARVTRRRAGGGWDYRISGPAWGGQVPIERVEVQIDGGTWQPARIDERRGQYAWLLWSLTVRDLAAGTHAVVSRAIDANGVVQPTDEERRKRLASGREDNAQWVREFLVV